MIKISGKKTEKDYFDCLRSGRGRHIRTRHIFLRQKLVQIVQITFSLCNVFYARKKKGTGFYRRNNALAPR